METNHDKEHDKVNEHNIQNKSSQIKIFKSFKEQEEFELQQMASLNPLQILEHLRKFINIAYGMHGFNPNNLPSKHTIRILTPKHE